MFWNGDLIPNATLSPEKRSQKREREKRILHLTDKEKGSGHPLPDRNFSQFDHFIWEEKKSIQESVHRIRNHENASKHKCIPFCHSSKLLTTVEFNCFKSPENYFHTYSNINSHLCNLSIFLTSSKLLLTHVNKLFSRNHYIIKIIPHFYTAFHSLCLSSEATSFKVSICRLLISQPHDEGFTDSWAPSYAADKNEGCIWTFSLNEDIPGFMGRSLGSLQPLNWDACSC